MSIFKRKQPGPQQDPILTPAHTALRKAATSIEAAAEPVTPAEVARYLRNLALYYEGESHPLNQRLIRTNTEENAK